MGGSGSWERMEEEVEGWMTGGGGSRVKVDGGRGGENGSLEERT